MDRSCFFDTFLFGLLFSDSPIFYFKNTVRTGGKFFSRAAPDATPSGSSAFAGILIFPQAENGYTHSLPTPMSGNPPPAAAGEGALTRK